jgi:Putative peptidoglycan binding domain
MSLTRVPMPSPCYSSRGGAGVRLLVIHTAEGARTIESLGNFFANASNEVSSHAGADDKANTVGIYVERPNKAWTAANYNPMATQIELCAFAAWSTAEWDQHPNILDNCAKWLAEEAAAFGIPLHRLSPAEAQGSGKGVCQHIDLGSGGGGHVDCGNGFPMDRVIQMAGGAEVAPPTPQPTPPPQGGGQAPPFPGTLLRNFTQGHGTFQWQTQMRARGWDLGADDMYGGESERVCTQFQQEKGLGVDGVVGPETWVAAWNAPIT